MSEAGPLHPIRAAARRCGLSEPVIRIWEHRYAAIVPIRGPSGRRLYSEDQIQRLILLRRAIERGDTISRLATLTDRELEERVQAPVRRPPAGTVHDPSTALRHRALGAIVEDDETTLERVLLEALDLLGYRGLVRRLLAPMALDLADCDRWPRDRQDRAMRVEGLLARLRPLRPAPFAIEGRPPGCLVWREREADWPLVPWVVRSLAESQGWEVTSITRSLQRSLPAEVSLPGASSIRLIVLLPAAGLSPDRLGPRFERIGSRIPSAALRRVFDPAGRLPPRLPGDGVVAEPIHGFEGLCNELDHLRTVARDR